MGIRKKYFNNYFARQLIDLAFKVELLEKESMKNNNLEYLGKLEKLKKIINDAEVVLEKENNGR